VVNFLFILANALYNSALGKPVKDPSQSTCSHLLVNGFTNEIIQQCLQPPVLDGYTLEEKNEFLMKINGLQRRIIEELLLNLKTKISD
jgi:hypothetical protein